MMNNRSCGCQRPTRPIETACSSQTSCNCENVLPCQSPIMPRQAIPNCNNATEQECSLENRCTSTNKPNPCGCQNNASTNRPNSCGCQNNASTNRPNPCGCQNNTSTNRPNSCGCQNNTSTNRPNPCGCHNNASTNRPNPCGCHNNASTNRPNPCGCQNNASTNRPNSCGCQNMTTPTASTCCDCKCNCQHPIFPTPIDSPCPCNMENDCLKGMPLAMAYVPWQPWQDVANGCNGLNQGTIFNDLVLPFHCEDCKGERRCNCR